MMKKTIKIVSMAEFHGSPRKPSTPNSTPRRGLVQGTLDIVTPRSPFQSCESVPISSPTSITSSRNSCLEDVNTTPRRDHPQISIYEAPLPERPSTSLELSDEETETCESHRRLVEGKQERLVPVVDGRGSRGAVEVALSFGSSSPCTKVQRHDSECRNDVSPRPFGDASNIPKQTTELKHEEPTSSLWPISPTAQGVEDVVGSCTGRFSGEENRKEKELDDSFSRSGIPAPKIIKASAGQLMNLTVRDKEMSTTSDLVESQNASPEKAVDSTELEKSKKMKKKKTGRVVESRYMKPPSTSLVGPALSTSMASSLGRPLLNSTALDSTHIRSSIAGSSATSRPKRGGATSAGSSDPHRLSSPASLSSRRLTGAKSKPVPGSRERPADRNEKAEKVSIVADGSTKKNMVCSQQDLDRLYTVYEQYAYLNALAENHSRRQEQQFQAEFGVLCEAYRERKEKLVTLQKELMYWKFVHSLENSITCQIGTLEPLLDLFPEFCARFTSVAEALDSTRHRIALKDLVLPSEDQLHSWQAQLAVEAGRSADILNKVLSESPINVNRLEQLCDIVEELVAMKGKHQQLFDLAKDIIQRADDLFAEEASLRIHEYQEKTSEIISKVS